MRQLTHSAKSFTKSTITVIRAHTEPSLRGGPCPPNNCLCPPLAYAGFSKGRVAGNLRIMKTKKRSPLRISPFFCPKLGEDQKKRCSIKFFPFLCSNFLPQLQKGGGMPQFCILFYANYTIMATQRGGHCTMAPLSTLLCPHISVYLEYVFGTWVNDKTTTGNNGKRNNNFYTYCNSRLKFSLFFVKLLATNRCA